jgi:hypothetical protein
VVIKSDLKQTATPIKGIRDDTAKVRGLPHQIGSEGKRKRGMSAFLSKEDT